MSTEINPYLIAWIKKCQGYNEKPYVDKWYKLAIGWGRNLDRVGIRPDEAELMIKNDIISSINDLKQYSWYLIQPEGVKNALINMHFNMGMQRLLTFRKMIAALINRDYNTAAIEVLDSKWARDLGHTAKDIAVMIREGN